MCMMELQQGEVAEQAGKASRVGEGQVALVLGLSTGEAWEGSGVATGRPGAAEFLWDLGLPPPCQHRPVPHSMEASDTGLTLSPPSASLLAV